MRAATRRGVQGFGVCCGFLVPFVLVMSLPAQCVIRIMAGSLVDSDI